MMTLPLRPLRLCALVLLALLATACSVHEWPQTHEKQTYSLELVFDTDFTKLELEYEARSDARAQQLEKGTMRYIVRAYPYHDSQINRLQYEEYAFTRNIAAGYNCSCKLDLAPGTYKILVWADLNENDSAAPYYDAADFNAITLAGEHAGNTDYRDAFRGTLDLEVKALSGGEFSDYIGFVQMQRPLAKFEFITTNLAEFLRQEGAESPDRYEAVFYYTDYMPCTYNMFSDKPVDSATGVMFRAPLRQLDGGDDEASLGFDYVFVNGTETNVSVKVVVYDTLDGSGRRVASTNTLKVPLRRSQHTIIRSDFLRVDKGGVNVQPGYEGDFIVPF